jgi:hypothetical protein
MIAKLKVNCRAKNDNIKKEYESENKIKIIK